MVEPKDIPQTLRRIEVARLNGRGAFTVDYRPSRVEIEDLMVRLDLLGLRKLRLSGTLSPDDGGWRLQAILGATVVQECVVTLEPVTTRIDEPVERRFSPGYEPPAAGESEMDEDDDSLEPLPEVIDLGDIVEEALALALPPYPRSPAAGPAQDDVQTDTEDPAPDDRVKPFSSLAALRDKLAGEDE